MTWQQAISIGCIGFVGTAVMDLYVRWRIYRALKEHRRQALIDLTEIAKLHEAACDRCSRYEELIDEYKLLFQMLERAAEKAKEQDGNPPQS